MAISKTQEPAPLISVPEAARLCGMGVTRAWALVADGTFDAVRFGRSTRIKRKSVDAFIAALPSARPAADTL